jgi:hypothetical protein
MTNTSVRGRQTRRVREPIFFFLLLALLGTHALARCDILVRTQGTTSTAVAVPRRPQPTTSGVLVLKNESPVQTAVVRLSTSRTPDLSTFDRILAAIHSKTPQETTVGLARTAYDMVSEYRQYNWLSAKPTDEVFDPVKLFNVYGYGLCDASARSLATILDGLGISARVWDLRVHVVTEFYDGRYWQSLDPDLRVHAYVPGTTRTMPARGLVAFRRQLQPAEVTRPDEAEQRRQQLVRALENVTSPPQPALWVPNSRHDAGVRLRPGETMVRFSQSQLGYYATLPGPPPPLYGNAVFHWERTLPAEFLTEDDLDDARIRSRFPYVIVGGTISVTSLEPGVPPPPPCVSVEGDRYEECELVDESTTDLEAHATYVLPRSAAGAYEIIVKLGGDDRLTLDNLPRIRYDQMIITQCSPTTFPALDGGEGDDYVHVEMSDDVPLDLSLLYHTPEELPDDFAVMTSD